LWPEAPGEVVSARIDPSPVFLKDRVEDALFQFTGKVNQWHILPLSLFFDWQSREIGPSWRASFFKDCAAADRYLPTRPTQDDVCQCT
jgi:hypothetical protein